MIRVTVELVPWGVGTPRVLGTAEIANTGAGTRTRGKYRATFRGKGGRVWRTATLEDFPRTRKVAWELLRRLLNNTGSE